MCFDRFLLVYIDPIRLPTEKAHGQQIVNTLASIRKLGIKTHIFLPFRKESSKIPEDFLSHYGIYPGPITFLPVPDHLELAKKMPSFINKFFFVLHRVLLALLAFSRLNNQKNCDKKIIILTQDIITGGILSFIKRKNLSIFIEVHDLPNGFKSLYSWIFKHFNGIVAITGNIKKRLVAMGIKTGKIAIIPDAVDPSKFFMPKEYQKFRQAFLMKHFPQNHDEIRNIIAYGGHLYPWKGTDILAKAGDYFDEKTLFLFIGGHAKDIERTKLLVKNQKAKSLFLGMVPPKDMPSYLSLADILVLPNSGLYRISKYFTSPLKLFEYMAMGKAIVASDLPSLREIIKDGENALLVISDNPELLAQGIKKLLKNPELAKKIGSNARIKAQYYSWDNRAKRIAEFMINSQVFEE